MKFDTVVIGGGLAGLTCAIELTRQGKSCAIISAGQGALHFLSGSLDLLNALPDGSRVVHPLNALASLAKQAPNHPYSIVGKDNIALLSEKAKKLLLESNISVTGDAQHNHMRLTPLGFAAQSWLSCEEIPTYTYTTFPWKKIAIVNIEGFMDFQPDLAANELQSQGIKVETIWLNLPVLDRLRSNPSEFRSVNIANMLDVPDNFLLLANEITNIAERVDAIIMPACIGMENSRQLNALKEKIAKPIFLLPTLPPSLLGMRIYQNLYRTFIRAGGQVMKGDTAIKATISENRVTEIYTKNHADIPVKAKNIVLATGSFFSKGLLAEYDKVTEPVFGLDIICENERRQWTQDNVFDAQPYMEFGVKTDNQLRGMINNQPIENLYVAGAVLGGFNPLQQGCGAGVSMITALHIAELINYKKEAM